MKEGGFNQSMQKNPDFCTKLNATLKGIGSKAKVPALPESTKHPWQVGSCSIFQVVIFQSQNHCSSNWFQTSRSQLQKLLGTCCQRTDLSYVVPREQSAMCGNSRCAGTAPASWRYWLCWGLIPYKNLIVHLQYLIDWNMYIVYTYLHSHMYTCTFF